MQIPTNWTFENRSVAGHFDSHVREQLPWYDLVTGALAHVVRHYLPTNGLMYDIGCSTGNVGRSVSDVLQARNAKLIGIESSAEMCARYDAPGSCVQADAARFDYQPFDVAVCYLVLMFLPYCAREALLSELVARVNCGRGHYRRG
jgi:tRNA (cmo5U34)-methyltransferase